MAAALLTSADEVDWLLPLSGSTFFFLVSGFVFSSVSSVDLPSSVSLVVSSPSQFSSSLPHASSLSFLAFCLRLVLLPYSSSSSKVVFPCCGCDWVIEVEGGAWGARKRERMWDESDEDEED